MGTLRIWLFGTLRLDHRDFAVDPALLRPVQGLLAYLLLRRERLHSRVVLAGLLRGERSDGGARRQMEPADVVGLARDGYLAKLVGSRCTGRECDSQGESRRFRNHQERGVL
jgi:hypothetical protein